MNEEIKALEEVAAASPLFTPDDYHTVCIYCRVQDSAMGVKHLDDCLWTRVVSLAVKPRPVGQLNDSKAIEQILDVLNEACSASLAFDQIADIVEKTGRKLKK